MFGSSILEMAIGLVLVYLLLSLICSAIQETMEGWSKVRASHLEQGLRELLQDRDGTRLQHLYEHPLIYGLFRGEYNTSRVRSRMTTNLPTYIPPGNFAVALMDTLVRGPVSRDPDRNDPAPSGELSIGTLRAADVAQAAAMSKKDMAQSADVASFDSSLISFELPIGWKVGNNPWYKELIKTAPGSFIGWLLTAIAISFGAPFWFDLLNKLIVLRSKMKPREKGTKEDPEAPRLRDKREVSLRWSRARCRPSELGCARCHGGVNL